MEDWQDDGNGRQEAEAEMDLGGGMAAPKPFDIRERRKALLDRIFPGLAELEKLPPEKRWPLLGGGVRPGDSAGPEEGLGGAGSGGVAGERDVLGLERAYEYPSWDWVLRQHGKEPGETDPEAGWDWALLPLPKGGFPEGNGLDWPYDAFRRHVERGNRLMADPDFDPFAAWDEALAEDDALAGDEAEAPEVWKLSAQAEPDAAPAQGGGDLGDAWMVGDFNEGAQAGDIIRGGGGDDALAGGAGQNETVPAQEPSQPALPEQPQEQSQAQGQEQGQGQPQAQTVPEQPSVPEQTPGQAAAPAGNATAPAAPGAPAGNQTASGGGKGKAGEVPGDNNKNTNSQGQAKGKKNASNKQEKLPLSPLGYDYRRTSEYKEVRKNGSIHGGIDIQYKDKTIAPIVLAAESGVVREIKTSTGAPQGDSIIVQTNDGYLHKYYHIDGEVYGIKQGDVIERGQVIGEYNLTGRTSGPHLHFETERLKDKDITSGERIDPNDQLKSIEEKYKDQDRKDRIRR